MAHADNAIRCHLRPDGSIAHIVEHDRDTGDAVATHGGQGYAVGTSWSRGQSWAVYGFTLSYIHTGEERYLNAAKQVANYFIAACADDFLPRLDFRAPAEPVYYDATAAAIAACGLLELGKLLPENEGGMYTNAAIKFLRALTERCADFNPDTDDMIGYGSLSYPKEEKDMWRVHLSIIYGDSYYVEALLKIVGEELFLW
jgi:unsaturated chondroitin disaccharide hydrolase